MAKLPPNAALLIDIDLLGEYREIMNAHEPHTKHYHDRAKFWLDRVGKLKGVFEVCDAHQIWIRVHIESRTYEGAQREVDALMKKIKTLHQSYLKRPKRYAEYQY